MSARARGHGSLHAQIVGARNWIERILGDTANAPAASNRSGRSELCP
jgi:hypothetical protein